MANIKESSSENKQEEFKEIYNKIENLKDTELNHASSHPSLDLSRYNRDLIIFGKNIETLQLDEYKQNKSIIKEEDYSLDSYSYVKRNYIDFKKLDFNDQELDWNISKLSILNHSENEIFFEDFGSENLINDHFELYNFLTALSQFGEKSLQSEFVCIEIGNEVVLINNTSQTSTIFTLKIGEGVLIGPHSLLLSELNKIYDVLREQIMNNMKSELFGISGSMEQDIHRTILNINAHNNGKFEPREVHDFAISMVIITNSAGIPILAKGYEKEMFKEDPILVSSFIHTLQLYFNNLSNDSLNSIQFGNSKFYLKWYDGHCYGVLISFDREVTISKNNPINRVGPLMINQLIESTNIVGNLESVDYIITEKMVDSFIEESKLGLKLSYTKELIKSDKRRNH